MRGGFRQNSGRKRGYAAKSAEEARKVLAEMVMKEIEPIGRALIKRAKSGDIGAAKELFDRAWGRSSQSISITQDPAERMREWVQEARRKYA